VEPTRVRPGVRRSVDCEYFRLEHIEPTVGVPVDVPASPPHCLHALAGRVGVFRDGEAIATLERGESAFVPAGVAAYRILAVDEPAAVIRVSLPPHGD
jgi:mannose-6-phosphate isomerase class I